MMKVKQFRVKMDDESDCEYFIEWKPSEEITHFIKVPLHAMYCLCELLKESGYQELDCDGNLMHDW